MDDTGFFCIGKITKTHGYNGAVVVSLDVDNPEDYENLESVFLEYNGKLVPFFIEEVSYAGKTNIRVTFQDYDTQKKIEEFIGCPLFLPSDISPDEEDVSPMEEYLSFAALDSISGKQIGIIARVESNPAHPLFVIDANGVEKLVPAVEEFIKTIDEKKKTIEFDLPEGLLDL